MGSKDIVITKIFDAPVDLVWRFWSESEYFKRWFGPEDAICIDCRMDFREGGKYHNCLRVKGSDGDHIDVWVAGVYKEIVPRKRIVFTDSFADEQGNVVPSTYYGIEGIARELEVAITFEDLGSKTKMILTHSKLHDTAKEARDAMEASWKESFNKIRRLL